MLVFTVFGCGEEETKSPVASGPDSTDTTGDSGNGFAYVSDTAPSTLADGYYGTLEITKPVQGFPVTRTDTVVLLISISPGYSYRFVHESRASNLCDSEGELAFGKGNLTVFESKMSLGGSCDSLRVPFGPMNSFYTDSSLVMDSSRKVVTGTGETESVAYDFELIAFNLFDLYSGTVLVEEYSPGTVDSTVDSVSITIVDSLLTMNFLTDSSRLCDVEGRIMLDPESRIVRLSVDSLTSDTTVCDHWLNLGGTFDATFRYDGVWLTTTRFGPIAGSAADSIKYSFVLLGM